MLIKKQDPFTGKINTLDLDITQDQIDRWNNGEFIQNVMPHLKLQEREFLMTGIIHESWQKYVINQDIPPTQNKIEQFINTAFSKSQSLDSISDLEKLMQERNRSKVNSILNSKGK